MLYLYFKTKQEIERWKNNHSFKLHRLKILIPDNFISLKQILLISKLINQVIDDDDGEIRFNRFFYFVGRHLIFYELENSTD